MTPASESNVDTVRGERAAALVNAARSVQSRASSVLAAGLMIALGLSALTWYYAHALIQRTHARATARSAATSRAQGEMPLPALGHIVAPVESSRAPQDVHADVAAVAPVDLRLPEMRTPAGLPSGGGVTAASIPPDASSGGATAKTPGELARDRRLSGEVFARHSDLSTPAATPGQSSTGVAVGAAAVNQDQGETAGDVRRNGASLASLLKPSATPAVQARVLPTARFLLPKGAFIDCTLETAIDSTLPGMTTCITASDTFGADGKVVLLERGSKLVGETRGQVQQGQARLFVLWTEVRTPTGVVVPLDSPGTDELGRAGLPGEVQHHFWERFGAALLISVIDGAVQAGVQAANRSGGTVLYAPSSSQDVLTEVLKDSVNIPPTVVKPNGDRIQVLVARDVDFRSVYELHTSSADH